MTGKRERLIQHLEAARLQRAQRLQDHPRLNGAVPLVALEADRDVARLASTRLDRAGARTESDRSGARPAADDGEARVLPLLAHRARVFHAGGWNQQRRARVAVPEWAEPVQLLCQVEVQGGPRNDRVHALDRAQVPRAERPGGVSHEVRPERIHGPGLDIEARSHAMAAEPAEVPGARGEPGMEVERRDAAPGPPAGA